MALQSNLGETRFGEPEAKSLDSCMYNNDMCVCAFLDPVGGESSPQHDFPANNNNN